MTIIFDFDGTIANTLETIIDIYNNYIVREFKCKPFDKTELDLYRKKRPSEFIRAFGVTPLKLPFIAWRAKSIMKKEIEQVEAFPNMIELIQQLFAQKRFQLGIVTSNSERNARLFLRKYNIEHCFDFVHGNKRLVSKSRALKSALRKNDLTREETVYVGDEIRDIAACKVVGIPIIAVTWGHNHKELLTNYEPEWMAENPENIQELVMAM